jgi:CSLREA domain-containing protein
MLYAFTKRGGIAFHLSKHILILYTLSLRRLPRRAESAAARQNCQKGENVSYQTHKIIRLAAGMLLLALIFGPLLPGQTSPVSAQGTAIHVTTTADEMTVNGSCSLREAIQAANTSTAVDACPAGTGSDTIHLPPGVYTLTRTGRSEDNNQTGDLDIHTSLTILGAGRDRTIIQQVEHYSIGDRLAQIHPTDARVTLRDLTIHGGRLYEGYADDRVVPAHGAGIWNAGRLTVIDVDFIDNNAADDSNGTGGAIFNQGELTIQNAYFYDNYSAHLGGAIHNAGVMAVENSHFHDNWSYSSMAISSAGGSQSVIRASRFTDHTRSPFAALILHAGEMTIRDSLFSGNQSGEMAMIYNSGTLTIEDSVFNDNQPGGSVIHQVRGQLTVRRSLFSGNTNHYDNGGAIYITQGPTLISDSTFHNNNAVNGGAVYNNDVNLTITGSLFYQNEADRLGGAIYNQGTMNLSNSTLSANTSGGYADTAFHHASGSSVLSFVTLTQNAGYALQVDTGTLQVRGSILANNQTRWATTCDTRSGPMLIKSLGGNVVGIAGRHCGWETTSSDLSGSLSEPLDALLGPLADHGGPTLTHALLPGSPALDAAGSQNCPPVDQRDQPRPSGPACDSGAFELQVLPTEMEFSIYLPFIGR